MVNFAAVLCHQFFQNRATVGQVNKADSIFTLYFSLWSDFSLLRELEMIVFGIIVNLNMEFLDGSELDVRSKATVEVKWIHICNQGQYKDHQKHFAKRWLVRAKIYTFGEFSVEVILQAANC
jgi:hypothetical protein